MKQSILLSHIALGEDAARQFMEERRRRLRSSAKLGATDKSRWTSRTAKNIA